MTVTPRREIDLVDGAFYGGDPHPAYTWMRENEPVYFDAAHNVWGLASYAAVLGASRDPATFSNAGGIRPDGGPIPMMIDMDDPEHWKRRKLVNRGFTPKRVRDSEQETRDKCDAIIDQVCERGECDFVARHRGAAPDGDDRRHARRSARRPRRPPALVRRPAQIAERQRDRGAVHRPR